MFSPGLITEVISTSKGVRALANPSRTGLPAGTTAIFGFVDVGAGFFPSARGIIINIFLPFTYTSVAPSTSPKKRISFSCFAGTLKLVRYHITAFLSNP